MVADFQMIAKAVDEIERILRDFSCGWRNEDALRQIENQAHAIRHAAGSMAYIDEKLDSLLDWVDKLYSARKWRRWGTIEQVKHFVLMECQRIKDVCA